MAWHQKEGIQMYWIAPIVTILVFWHMTRRLFFKDSSRTTGAKEGHGSQKPVDNLFLIIGAFVQSLIIGVAVYGICVLFAGE